MKALHNIGIHPGNALLVIVDVQNEFCQPDGKWYSEISPRIVPSSCDYRWFFSKSNADNITK